MGQIKPFVHTLSVVALSSFLMINAAKAQQRESVALSSERVAVKENTSFVNDAIVQQAVSPDKLIQGRISGVQVLATDGANMGSLTTIIRGVNSLRGNTEPLWVLDGVILNPSKMDTESNLWTVDQNYQSVVNSLAAINPNDIESIVVLKDIAATAIYGSMGGNGVVLITTKRGTSKTPLVAWNSSVGISSKTKSIEMLSAREYERFQAIRTGTMPTLTNPVDWQDEAFRTAISQNHNLSVQSNQDNSSYYIAGNLRKLQGIIKGDDATLGGLQINFDQKATKYLDLGTRMLIHYNNTNMTKGADALGRGGNNLLLTTSIPALGGYTGENYNSYREDYDDFANEYRVIPSLYLNFHITKKLSLENTAGVDYRKKTRYMWMGRLTDLGLSKNGAGGYSTFSIMRYNASSMLSYNVTNGGHVLNMKAGVELNGNRNKQNTATGYDFSSQALRAKGLTYKNEGSPIHMFTTQDWMFSPMATLSYHFSDLYAVEATLRADNTPHFDGGKYTFFPAISVSRNLKVDPTFSNVDILSSLSIRGGIGKAGTKTIAPYEMFHYYYAGAYPQFANQGAYIYHNMYARTTSKEANVALDFGFLKDRITGSVGYYYKETMDNLQMVSFGAENPKATNNTYWSFASRHTIFESSNEFRNAGLEFTLSSQIIKSQDLNWTVTAYGAANTNTLKHVSDNFGQNVATDLPVTANRYNQSINSFWGYKSNGLVTAENIAKAPTFNGAAAELGDVLYQDLDGNGDITAADRQLIGNPHPKFIGSLNSQLSLKRFSFEVLFDGVYGNDILNLSRLMEENVSGTGNIRYETLASAYSRNNTNTSTPKIGSKGAAEVSDRFVEDGSFLRMTNLTVGYTIPLTTLKWVKSLTVNVSGSNLFMLTSYKGWSPDVNSYSGDISRYGVDYGSYPMARTFTLGVSATF